MTTTKVKEQIMSVTITQNNISKAVKSYTMSKRYINTATRATVINILYHRLNIGEKEFSTKTFKNISYKTFRPNSKNIVIRQFHSYMTACKDALEKNYLRAFYLFFIDSTTGDILENYKFVFRYCDKEEEKISQNQDDLTEATCELLQNLKDLGGHDKLGDDIEIKVEFTYYDDTPDDYEPPCFEAIQESDALIKKLNKNGNNSVEIGKLFTGFHIMKCRGIGKIFNLNDSQTASFIEVPDFSIEERNMYYTADDNDEANNHKENILTEDLTELTNVTIIHPKTSNRELNASYLTESVDISSESYDEDMVKDCSCKLPPTFSAWQPDTIVCETCRRRFHAPCQGYLDKTFVEKNYKCGQCNTEETDSQSICNLFDVQSLVPLSRVRFILACVYKTSKIPREVQSVFPQVTEVLRNGSDTMELMEKLFKFDHKDPNKKKIENAAKMISETYLF